jgi:hypothetical protein
MEWPPGSIYGSKQQGKPGRVGGRCYNGKAGIVNITGLGLRLAIYDVFSLEKVLSEIIAPVMAVFYIDKKQRQEA